MLRCCRHIVLSAVLPAILAFGATGCAEREDRVPLIRGEGPLYCYRTIGEEMCHDQPLPGEGNRLVGYYGPRPY